MAKISVVAIKTEACGDWHDKPLKWAVLGPAQNEVQKFSTKAEALKYKSVRFRSYDQQTAFHNYARLP